MPSYYDYTEKRLVFLKEKAVAKFWDQHWAKSEIADAFKYASVNMFIKSNTSDYLCKGSRILEGGCGLGQNLYSLHRTGYRAYGLDYAADTVLRLKKYQPELDLVCGDVRSLPFEDCFFDGYWSLGVIEHFYDGFEPILKEMSRVIKPGGYLFLTFPCMSWGRKKKASAGKYRPWNETVGNVDKFYQFALDPEAVAMEFEKNGFMIIKKKSIAGVKGFKDELESKSFKRFFQALYDSRSLPVRALVFFLDILLSPLFGHSAFLILERKGK